MYTRDIFSGRRHREHEDWVAPWDGGQPAAMDGDMDTVTLELDLDRGTLSVWKNDAHLGVMATGLSGEFVCPGEAAARHVAHP